MSRKVNASKMSSAGSLVAQSVYLTLQMQPLKVEELILITEEILVALKQDKAEVIKAHPA